MVLQSFSPSPQISNPEVYESLHEGHLLVRPLEIDNSREERSI